MSHQETDSVSDPIPFRELGTDLAREVSELLLLKNDLIWCVDGFKLWGAIETKENDTKQEHAAASLFRDSVVTFVSCFDDRLPHNLEVADVYSQENGGVEYFRWLEGLRNTWIAHRSGPSRCAAYGFIIHPQSGEILGHGPFTGAYLSADQSGWRDLVRFTEIALRFVEALLATKIADLIGEAEHLYPNQRLRLKTVRFTAPSPEHLQMGRQKYKNISRSKVNKPGAEKGEK